MKINREKLLEMWGLFEKLSVEKSSVKFHYTVLKNKRLIEPEVESLKKANNPPEKYREFEEARLVLCNDMCEKDEDGKPKTENNNFVIAEEIQKDFKEKLDSLKEDYKEMFEEIDKAQKEFEDLLKEDIDIEFVRIPISIMPDSLSGQEVSVLFDIVDEDK